MSIVVREYTEIVGQAAQVVFGKAAQLLSSPILHNARLAPPTSYWLTCSLLAASFPCNRFAIASSRWAVTAPLLPI